MSNTINSRYLLLLFIISLFFFSGCDGCGGYGCCSSCCCDCCGQEGDEDGDQQCGAEDAECTYDGECGTGCSPGYRCIQKTDSEDNKDSVCEAISNPEEICGNSEDEDCADGSEGGYNARGARGSCDFDQDGFISCSFQSATGGGCDCDDNDATVYPGAEEECDPYDHDCDSLGLLDNVVASKIPACPLQKGVCAGSVHICQAPVFSDDTNSYWGACGVESYGPDYEFVETRCDGKDNDCNGEVDEGVCI